MIFVDPCLANCKLPLLIGYLGAIAFDAGLALAPWRLFDLDLDLTLMDFLLSIKLPVCCTTFVAFFATPPTLFPVEKSLALSWF